MKYFYYISKTKVEMLQAQVDKPKFSISSISSKLGFGPASVTVAAEKQNHTLVANTLKLLKTLENSRSIRPSDSLSKLDTAHFYHDQGIWKSGLFTFDSWCNNPTVIYALWRELERALILLVGSPNNILGDKIVVGDYFVPGTSGAHLAILKYVGNVLCTDELVAVRTGPSETYGRNVPVPELSNSKIILPKSFESRKQLQRRNLEEEDDLYCHEERGLTLGCLCLRQLKVLPESHLDLVFRMFSTYDIPNEDEVERFGSWKPEERLAKARTLGLFKYDRVYLGSPVYTALD